MDIAYFIRELILLNECVILRGIGGFETTYKNAVLDKNKRQISPPGKIIHFRPDLVKDNGVLESHIARSLKIDRKEASENIDEFVQEFHDSIRNYGKVFMEGIGEFSLAKDNSISFIEIGDENYLADSFGLDVLDIELDSSGTENIKKPELQPSTPEKRKLTGWYIIIGILLILITVTTIILVSSPSGLSIFAGKGEKQEIKESDVIVFGPKDKVTEDSTLAAIGQSIDENTLPKKALSIQSTPSSQFQVGDISYYLIAGSFKYTKNAERLKVTLQGKGFNPTIMTKGSYIRVVLGEFNDKELALSELRRIRYQFDQSVWLMED